MGIQKPISAGTRFWRLVVSSIDSEPNRRLHYRCVCDCGGQSTVIGAKLRTGQTKSCGCLRRDATSTTHGHSGGVSTKRSAEYTSWVGMRRRCLNHKDGNYHDYGGRGITMRGVQGFPRGWPVLVFRKGAA